VQVIPRSRVVALGYLAKVFSGLRYSPHPDDRTNRDTEQIRELVKTVRIQDLPKNKEIDAEEVSTIDPGALNIIRGVVRPPRDTNYLRTSDILLSITGTVGRVSLVGEYSGRAVASSALAVIRCGDATTSQYVAALLGTEPYQKWLVENSSGAYI